VKPPPFEYDDPRSVAEAVALLAEFGDEAKVLAGGQSLVPLLNFRLVRPRYLVDVNRVADLDYIRPLNGGLTIGALTRQRTVETSDLVRERCPLLHEAIQHVGTSRSAIAAPSVAAWPTPIRPPSCRPSRRRLGHEFVCTARPANGCWTPASSSSAT
jgi:FAD binding domain in molybdopterin dehydrogenase